MKLPENWIEKKLGSVLTRVNDKINPQTSGEKKHFYIGLEHIERQTGKLLLNSDETTDANDILSMKTVFQKGDILYGKLRPNLNKVHLAEQDGICSTDIWALRPQKNISPDFILRFLRSPAVYERATQLAAGANLPRVSANSFDRLPIFLPTLPEQHRIVDVLKQLEDISRVKQSVHDQINHIIRTAYWEYFSDWYTSNGLRNPVRISKFVEDSQYGVSEAMKETGDHVVLRMNSITKSGWLDLAELKYATLSKKDVEATTLVNGDLLFNRTNSRELVGKCAIWRDAEGPFSFASYLVRLRLKEGMLPEYLWATLNSSYGKYRLMNSAKQAVSMANVSPTDLGRITVPLPPLALQKKFARLVNSIETLREKIQNKLHQYSELQTLVTQQALFGELTTKWRHENKELVSDAESASEVHLRKLGVKVFSPVLPTPIKTPSEDINRPNRKWLIDELSKFQRQVLEAFINYSEQPLLVEDAEEFNLFCNDDNVLELLSPFGSALNNRIRRTLSQLASLGLIAKVTLPKNNQESGIREYLKAFRPLREEEFTRLQDIATLRKQLSAGETNHFFMVTQDFATSAHAGASGMFQVVSLIDDNENDRTNLIDVGQHYSSLNELAKDIAVSLGVRSDKIELDTD